MFWRPLATAVLLIASTLAQSPQTAIITITTSHGGAGNGLTNETITCSLNKRCNSPALDAVSYLYLTGSTGAPALDSISCQAYQDAAGTVSGGNPFNSSTPALLSTNTVKVGSIVCTSTYIAMAPPGGNFSTSILATPTSSSGGSNLSTTATSSTRRTSASSVADSGPVTSIYVTTMSGGSTAEQSTITSVFVPSETEVPASPTSDEAGQQSGSATASASAGLSTPNAGFRREFGSEMYAGLAAIWIGVAYVL